MDSRRKGRRFAAIAGGAAIIAMVGLTAACGGGGKESPSSTTTPTTTTTTTEAPTTTAPPVSAHREEHQPHRWKPVHAAGVRAAGADAASRRSPQQLEAKRSRTSPPRASAFVHQLAGANRR